MHKYRREKTVIKMLDNLYDNDNCLYVMSYMLSKQNIGDKSIRKIFRLVGEAQNYYYEALDEILGNNAAERHYDPFVEMQNTFDHLGCFILDTLSKEVGGKDEKNFWFIFYMYMLTIQIQMNLMESLNDTIISNSLQDTLPHKLEKYNFEPRSEIYPVKNILLSQKFRSFYLSC